MRLIDTPMRAHRTRHCTYCAVLYIHPSRSPQGRSPALGRASVCLLKHSRKRVFIGLGWVFIGFVFQRDDVLYTAPSHLWRLDGISECPEPLSSMYKYVGVQAVSTTVKFCPWGRAPNPGPSLFHLTSAVLAMHGAARFQEVASRSQAQVHRQ